MSTTPTYSAGDRVVYFQPGLDAILSSLAGEGTRSDARGEEKTVTLTSAEYDPATGRSYYDADDGMFLTDSDIRRRA